MRLLPVIVAFLMTCSCSWFRAEPKEDEDFDRYNAVDTMRRQWLLELYQIRDQETTWPVSDCDGWIWAGKAAAAGAIWIDVGESEYPDEPGRFGRRPPIDGEWCGPGAGSESTWSADMFKCGMLPYALLAGNLNILERHRDYGKAHGWRMGDPASSDRVFYKPNIRGWMARAIKHLDGGHDDDALIPDVYIAGQTDYQAHLQMCGIWAAGEMEGSLLPSQVERIEEHYSRSPGTLFYAYMYARWVSGDIDPVADALLADPDVAGDYVRCGDSEPACHTAEKAFVAALVQRNKP